MKRISKKTIILYILKILYCYTSEKYAVTQTEIAEFLNDSGITCDRKTVGRNIGYMINIGLPICKSHKKERGYYYDINKDNFFVRKNASEKEILYSEKRNCD